jgi:hypothetical protein
MKHFLISSISLLFFVSSNTFLYAQRQTYSLPEAQVTAAQPVERLKLIAHQPQQYKVSFMAGQQVTLKIHSKSTPAFGKLLKKVTPFAVAGVTQLNQSQGPAMSTEVNGSKPFTNQFKAGLTMGVGALAGLTPSRSNRSLATISLYNSFGQLRKTETRWLKSKNETLRIISKKRDGYAIITLQSPIDRQLSIEPSTQDLANARVNSRGTGPGNGIGNQPITNGGDCNDPEDPNCEEDLPDYGDYGITGGSGSMSDPYILAAVTVVAQGSGQTTTIDLNFLSYTGGYYNNTYYPPGNYSTDLYDLWMNSGTYSTGSTPWTGGNNEKDIELVVGKCDGFKRMLALQKETGHEVAAFVTTDDKVFILPMEGNTEILSNTSNIYKDSQDRVIFTVYQENGTWKVQLVDYSTNPPSLGVLDLAYHVHTHPMNGNQNTASPTDQNFANSYQGLPKYIVNMRRIVSYDASGATGDRKLKDDCPNP